MVIVGNAIMLDFAFTPEQEAFRRSMRRLALEELLPRYAQGDRDGIFPAWQRRRIYDTIGVPVEQDFILAGIATEEVARGDFTCGFFAAAPFRDNPFLDALPEHLQASYEELPIAQRLRDGIGWQIGDGTPQIQKVILARALLGRAFSPIA